MNHIKRKTLQYLKLVDLKSSIKNEECQEKVLKSNLEKLQAEVFELSNRIDTIKWKIKRAEFILSCEKERHNFFYSSIKASEEVLTKEVFSEEYKIVLVLDDYRKKLEKEKTLFTRQIEELTK